MVSEERELDSAPTHTVPGYFRDEDNQLSCGQDIDHPSDFPLKPSVFAHTPFLPPRIGISYEWVVLIVWFYWRYNVRRIILGLATVQWYCVVIVKGIRIIMYSPACSSI